MRHKEAMRSARLSKAVFCAVIEKDFFIPFNINHSGVHNQSLSGLQGAGNGLREGCRTGGVMERRLIDLNSRTLTPPG